MSIMSNAKRALAIAAAAATLLSMAACGSSNAASGKSDSSGAASSGKIEVVASINQWGSVAEDLGGSNVEVTNIMTKTNVEAHDYEPTSQDVAKFGTAKVAVVNGADYDPWATKAAQPTKATLVTAAETAGIKEGDNPHVCMALLDQGAFDLCAQDHASFRAALIQRSMHTGNAMAMRTCMTPGSFGRGVSMDLEEKN